MKLSKLTRYFDNTDSATCRKHTMFLKSPHSDIPDIRQSILSSFSSKRLDLCPLMMLVFFRSNQFQILSWLLPTSVSAFDCSVERDRRVQGVPRVDVLLHAHPEAIWRNADAGLRAQPRTGSQQHQRICEPPHGRKCRFLRGRVGVDMVHGNWRFAEHRWEGDGRLPQREQGSVLVEFKESLVRRPLERSLFVRYQEASAKNYLRVESFSKK